MHGGNSLDDEVVQAGPQRGGSVRAEAVHFSQNIARQATGQ